DPRRGRDDGAGLGGAARSIARRRRGLGERLADAGLTRGTGHAHLVRAALEGMCHQTRDVVETTEQVSGVPLGALRADGGGSANGWLM
ncbi:hypothetical protein CNY89_28305, partial [Amaricoccus sp. HAR-UPW-R2A-40]